MLKSKMIYNLLLCCGLLASVATLAACGQKGKPLGSTSASPSSTVQTTQSSVATSDASQSVGGVATVSEVVTESSHSDHITRFDLDGLVSGDYSSIAGTWSNAEGTVFTVTAEGILYFGEEFDEMGYHQIEQVGLDSNGRVSGSVSFYHHGERRGGAHISMIPAGVPNINGLISDVDHIETGHDVSSADSEKHYFRQ